MTNRGALRRKYGGDAERVEAAIQHFVTSRRNTGIDLELFYLDELPHSLGVDRVAHSVDSVANLTAIGALHRALRPAYLLIIGSIDVVPHQLVPNPHAECIDRDIATDWAYASSTTELNSLADVRLKVGRIPGITGSRSPDPLISALSNASRPDEPDGLAPSKPFVLCSESFRQSTHRIAMDAFGTTHPVHSVPHPEQAKWSDKEVGGRLHLINCHGYPRTPYFSGRAATGPTSRALCPEQLDGRLSVGTIAAVTCCYGADLYRPVDPTGGTRYMPMCNAFLRFGATGYFGSTGSSHGGTSELKEADRLVRDFLRGVVSGETTGSAALSAILALARGAPDLEVSRVAKNCWQFILLGDPTVRLSRDRYGPSL